MSEQNQNQKDVLGEQGNSSDKPDATDKSCRGLKTVAEIRSAVTQRGGQPV